MTVRFGAKPVRKGSSAINRKRQMPIAARPPSATIPPQTVTHKIGNLRKFKAKTWRAFDV